MPPPQRRQTAPSPWVRRFAPLIPHPGPVLDLACGHGRHVHLLRSSGYHVVAIDRDSDVAANFVTDENVEFVAADLEAGDGWPLPMRHFSGIVVTNYLYRPLFSHITSALLPGGILIYETFAAGNERYGKPSNPAFLLQPGELLDAFATDLTVIGYEHGKVTGPMPRIAQRICAAKPDPEVLSSPARIG